ncbi:MAG TPA: metal-dependent hydrolase [Polyangiales bacterium]
MASIGHIAVGMAAARWYRGGQSAPLSTAALGGSVLLWSALSLAPDLDVVGFRLGIPYHAAWGHRGATHSIVFCLVLALALASLARLCERPVGKTFVLAALVLISHPLLDVLTDGGLGCALGWPFESRRYFAPYTPIPVAPIGRAFFSPVGLRVALSELLLFAPLFAYALWPRQSEAAS